MTPLTCRALVAFLDDYLAGALDEGSQAAFHEHLAACPSCVAYMKTYQATLGAVRETLLRQPDLPEDVPEGLVAAVLAACLPN